MKRRDRLSTKDYDCQHCATMLKSLAYSMYDGGSILTGAAGQRSEDYVRRFLALLDVAEAQPSGDYRCRVLASAMALVDECPELRELVIRWLQGAGNPTVYPPDDPLSDFPVIGLCACCGTVICRDAMDIPFSELIPGWDADDLASLGTLDGLHSALQDLPVGSKLFSDPLDGAGWV